MAFDEALAVRVRRALAECADVKERRMFGGLCFLVGGSMACGVVKNELCVRVGPDRHEEALMAPHTRPMDFTGKPMRGFVYVKPAGLSTAASLGKWVEMGVTHALSPPAKRRRTRHPG
jgi:hypothetical protein